MWNSKWKKPERSYKIVSDHNTECPFFKSSAMTFFACFELLPAYLYKHLISLKDFLSNSPLLIFKLCQIWHTILLTSLPRLLSVWSQTRPVGVTVLAWYGTTHQRRVAHLFSKSANVVRRICGAQLWLDNDLNVFTSYHPTIDSAHVYITCPYDFTRPEVFFRTLMNMFSNSAYVWVCW